MEPLHQRKSNNAAAVVVAVGEHCRVCDDPNGQQHYGTICCPSCKGFFRRVYLSNKKFECYRGNMCKIREGNRNICRACRYKKCLQAGMNVKEIRGKMEKKAMTSSPSRSSSASASSTLTSEDEDEASPKNQSTSQTKTTSSPSTTKSSFELTKIELTTAIEFGQLFMNLDKYCENNYCETMMTNEEENILINRMLSSSVIELIQKTSPQCPRFKREWKPFEMLNFENFCRSWSRSIVHFLDYSTKIPIFNQLKLLDQKSWFISRLVSCTLTTMSIRTRIEQCEGLLFGCSNVFPLKQHQWGEVKDEKLRDLFKKITQILFSYVITPIINLKFTEIHYALLKACVFFSQGITVDQMSSEGIEMMRHECVKYKNALLKLLLNDVDGYMAQSDIVFQLDDILCTLERVAAYFDQEIQYFHFLGVPIVQKNLLTECHVTKLE